MEAHSKSGIRVRKALADRTNTVTSSQLSSSSSLKPRNRKLLSNSVAGTGAASFFPPAVEATPSPAPRLSSESDRSSKLNPLSLGKGRLEDIEPRSVYSRRPSAKKTGSKLNLTVEPLSLMLSADKRKSKGKETVESLSCPPATKIRKIGRIEKISDAPADDNIPKACTTVCKKKRDHRPSVKHSDALSQEYIEQQRAYFAEIDAFELQEEEVEAVDELD